jgi:hypothetical protein
MKGGNEMTLNEAIEVLKEWGSLYDGTSELLTWDMNVFNEAIDTVVAELEKPLPTEEQIEAYALENILDGVGIQSMINTKAWIAGARWMRDLIQKRSKK